MSFLVLLCNDQLFYQYCRPQIQNSTNEMTLTPDAPYFFLQGRTILGRNVLVWSLQAAATSFLLITEKFRNLVYNGLTLLSFFAYIPGFYMRGMIQTRDLCLTHTSCVVLLLLDQGPEV